MPLERDKDAEAIYAIHREYIQHEDHLVNHRTTALITMQAFLITTFGFTYQKKYEIAEKLFSYAPAQKLSALGSITDEYNGLLLIIAVAGACTSLIAWRSIRAAVKAIQALQRNWLRITGGVPPAYLPGLTGGGDGPTARQGVMLPLAAPLFLLALWLVTIFYLIFKFPVPFVLK